MQTLLHGLLEAHIKIGGKGRRLERAALSVSKTRGGLVAVEKEAGTLKRLCTQNLGAQAVPNIGAGLGESGTTPTAQEPSIK